jgi:hypothetical protein
LCWPTFKRDSSFWFLVILRRHPDIESSLFILGSEFPDFSLHTTAGQMQLSLHCFHSDLYSLRDITEILKTGITVSLSIHAPDGSN